MPITISVSEYAAMRDITPQAVIKAIKKNHRTPGVTEVRKIGNQYILTVNVDVLKNSLVVNRKPPKLHPTL